MSEDPAWMAWQAVESMHERVEAELGRRLGSGSHLSCADYKVLAAIEAHAEEHVRPYELVESLGWEKSRVSHQVRRMLERGLLERTECPIDRRGSYVGATALARDAMAEAGPAYTDAVQALLGDTLTPAQLEAVRDAAETVVERLSPAPTGDSTGGGPRPVLGG